MSNCEIKQCYFVVKIGYFNTVKFIRKYQKMLIQLKEATTELRLFG
jgi:hypothetical protein